MTRLLDSELIVNPDGSIYHLNLLPHEVASKIVFVGDPDRVSLVSKHFQSIEVKKQKREFLTHTGKFKGERISVISTGIGTDNIDIVLNELDALVNIDLQSKSIKKKHRELKIIRVGTSGSLQESLSVDSFLASSHAIDFSGLSEFYQLDDKDFDQKYNTALHAQLSKNEVFLKPFTIKAPGNLIEDFKKDSSFTFGATATCAGFYAPQGRQLRLTARYPQLLNTLSEFQFENFKITNFEMESAGIYLLARLLGHQALSLNAIIANRKTGEFSKNPGLAVENLIKKALEKLCP